jgi:hypothetical protein
MDAIVNGCEIEREAPVNEEYGDEVLCAGWNPQLTLAAENPVSQIDRHDGLPANLANMDIDNFLKKMYEYLC